MLYSGDGSHRYIKRREDHPCISPIRATLSGHFKSRLFTGWSSLEPDYDTDGIARLRGVPSSVRAYTAALHFDCWLDTFIVVWQPVLQENWLTTRDSEVMSCCDRLQKETDGKCQALLYSLHRAYNGDHGTVFNRLLSEETTVVYIFFSNYRKNVQPDVNFIGYSWFECSSCITPKTQKAVGAERSEVSISIWSEAYPYLALSWPL